MTVYKNPEPRKPIELKGLWAEAFESEHNCPHCDKKARAVEMDSRKAGDDTGYIVVYSCPNGHEEAAELFDWESPYPGESFRYGYGS